MVRRTGFHSPFRKYGFYRNTGSKTGHVAGTYGYVDYARISADLYRFAVMGKNGNDQPSFIQYDAALQTAPLCYYASRLKDKVYSIHRGNGQKYLHWQLLWNDENTGYIQQLQDAETQIFRLFETISSTNDKQFPDTEKIKASYKQAESIITTTYRQLDAFDGLIMNWLSIHPGSVI